ncbi:MAG: ATP-binding cassette domain-containing protein [Pseudomonadota bacterium]|nr:ATP-binding cassette domain-containing protein [Pseudomonadota bacterium]
MNEIFVLDNISIISKKKKLQNLNLKVKKGDFFIIRGSNASGKSLLLKLFYLKILPTSGNLYLLGKKVSEDSKKIVTDFRKKMGVILQNDYLIPFFSVYQNIELASQIQNRKTNFSERMNELSKWLELDEIKDEKVTNLSNSQKQKVVIARALINNPRIIVADQPENFLDESSTEKIFFLLESLSKLGSSIIITSNRKLDIKVKHKVFELN